MRIVLIILIGIHGIIHLFGFLKAYEISEFNAITQPVSKFSGIFWLFSFILFAITAALLLVHSDYWWFSGILALIFSQILIFGYWSDAKFGSIANIIILIPIIIAYSNYSFKSRIKEERTALLKNSHPVVNQKIRTEASFSRLPPVIQKWLINSGANDKPAISNVYLTQDLQLKLKPEQSEWNYGSAEQYFTIQPPAFNWSINTEMNSFLSVVGRDKFENGNGEMIIKLLSLIPVADAKNDTKVNQATLQRYLAEIVWFPSASLSSYIKWEPVDDYSAKAIMEYNGTIGSGVFYFDEKGDFKKFITMRYKDSTANEPTEWTVIATKTEKRNGIRIPVECEVNWKLDTSDWNWLKLKITSIRYNIPEMPVTKLIVKD